jgi:hypothetical protein
MNWRGPMSHDLGPDDTRVPVALPQVVVIVNTGGLLTVTVDHQPYRATDENSPLDRSVLGRTVDQIAAGCGCPVRVEVHESDGSTFTDIVTPRQPRPQPRSSPAQQSAVALTTVLEVAGRGFAPGEQVAVAVVVAHQVAAADGTARLRLPTALMSGRPGAVVLLGRETGTTAVSGAAEPAVATAAGAA